MQNLLSFLKTIADENRLKILKLLLNGEYCVCQLELLLNKSQSSISQHLSYFKELDLLNENKDGKWTYYSIDKRNYDKYLSELIALNYNSLEELGLEDLAKKTANLKSAAEIKVGENKRRCCS